MFSVSAGSGNGSSHARLLILSLAVDAGRNVGIAASYGSEAGDVGVAELEEPVDKPRTTTGTHVSVLHFIRLPSLMSCGF